MWARLVNAALGVWLMAAPAVLGYGEPLSTSDRIVGPLVFSFAVMAIWQVLRTLRWVNFAFGFWLVVAPWILSHSSIGTVNGVAVGVAVIAFSLVKGRIENRVGGGWSYLWKG